MAIIDYQDYLAEGMYIFPLHEIVKGKCGCGDPECFAVGKHPLQSSWQHITTWDEDQIAYFSGEDGIGTRNCFEGFGVNLAGHHILVVDVDARNGGVEALERLNSTLGINLKEIASFVVLTGSGNGSLHIYFRIPESWQANGLLQGLDAYKGIDFKTTGFVVGCGSIHVSGDYYTAIKGGPSDIGDAPINLLELLKRPDRIRSTFSGSVAEYSFEELQSIVEAIKNPGRDYEKWIRIGMAIHHATNGSMDGYSLWVDWSRKGEAHNESRMDMKWHSFGKNPQDQVTIGTLTVWAKEDGYSAPVTFECDTEWEITGDSGITSIESIASCNLTAPPGFVGRVAEWINSRCMYPRKHLAVGAALSAVSNAAGLRYRVKGYNTRLNMIIFGVAGSGSGKGEILQSLKILNDASGISMSIHGNIKSEQEAIRNQMRNQAACYVIDEAGSFLGKITNSKKSGKTSYLENLIGTVMSLYSETGSYALSGDLAEEVRKNIQIDIAKIQKRADDGDLKAKDDLEKAIQSLKDSKNGIKEPYLSFFGVSEPISFDAAVNNDQWLLTGGFIGRAVVLNESDSVPKRRKIGEFGDHELPMGISMQLSSLYSGGEAAAPGDRVQRNGDVVYIGMTPEAIAAEQEIYEYWHEQGVREQADGTSLTALTNRATEITIKVAAILGVAGGQITYEHMRWAHALVYRTMHEKMDRAKANMGHDSKDSQELGDAVLSAVKSMLTRENPVTPSAISARYKPKYTLKQIKEALDWLVAESHAQVTENKGGNGRVYKYYKLA